MPVSSSTQPGLMASMLEQLALAPGQQVLEIGAGTGYNAALMAQIVGATGHVITVDLDTEIVEAARAHLRAAGCTNVTVMEGDGADGYAAGAPYDRIIITASNSHFEHNVIPHRWLHVANGLPPPADQGKSRILDHLGPSAR